MVFGLFEARAGGALFLLFLVGLVFVEAIWLIWVRKRTYDWRASAASFGVALGRRIIDAATAGIAAAVLFWVYQYRLFTIEMNSVLNFLLLFILFELAYYWHHRLAHEVRWLWATHSVHHSPEEMNLSVSVRLGWTGAIIWQLLVLCSSCIDWFSSNHCVNHAGGEPVLSNLDSHRDREETATTFGMVVEYAISSPCSSCFKS